MMDEYIKAVITESGLTEEQFFSPCRKRKYVMAREIAAHHLSSQCGLIDRQIGEALNRSRGTVFNLLRTYNLDSQYDESFKDLLERVEKRYGQNTKA